VAGPSTTSVIVPALNEAVAIGALVRALRDSAPWHEKREMRNKRK